MDAHVVAVSVAAGRVVGEQDVGVLLAQDDGERLGCFLDGHRDEAPLARRVGKHLRAHTRIGVAERLEPGDAEPAGTSRYFVPTSRRELVSRAVFRPGEAERAVRRHDEDDVMPLRRGLCHRAGGEQRLVVGVGMECDEGASRLAVWGGDHRLHPLA